MGIRNGKANTNERSAKAASRITLDRESPRLTGHFKTTGKQRTLEKLTGRTRSPWRICQKTAPIRERGSGVRQELRTERQALPPSQVGRPRNITNKPTTESRRGARCQNLSNTPKAAPQQPMAQNPDISRPSPSGLHREVLQGSLTDYTRSRKPTLDWTLRDRGQAAHA